eukprot:TRINITY_DN13136_c0_g2_i1.p1 TRINITY_DN13136_c0_g2~~TRINITY_DN13136_c0_g2_i1.p1  ORF type:complete len:363 (+),score=77.24 TRINITY_DN13136_c0_g2_i1:69-1091(+)
MAPGARLMFFWRPVGGTAAGCQWTKPQDGQAVVLLPACLQKLLRSACQIAASAHLSTARARLPSVAPDIWSAAGPHVEHAFCSCACMVRIPISRKAGKVPLRLLLLLLLGRLVAIRDALLLGSGQQSWLGTLPLRRGLAQLAATGDAEAGLATKELLQALGRELWLAAEEVIEEPAPNCEWLAAKRSLKEMSASLASSAKKVKGQAQFAKCPRMLAFDALTRASEGLLRATKLFSPSTFYMPPDPRATKSYRGEWSDAAKSSSSFPGWSPVPEPEAVKLGSPEAKLVAEVLKEIEEASDQGRRSSVLRQLIRKLHPDQNPGREKEVLPAFNFVQRLRERE